MMDDTWQTVDTAPVGQWIRTTRLGEHGANVCLKKSRHEFIVGCEAPILETEVEWIERETGVTTVTHSTFLPPTHWQPIIVYCCGILFDRDGAHLALVRKYASSWRAGRLNGLSGEVKPSENIHKAMRRICMTETSIDISKWNHVATADGIRGFEVHYLTARHDLFGMVSTDKSQLLTVRNASVVVSDPTIASSLRWLIPLILSDKEVVTPIRFRDSSSL